MVGVVLDVMRQVETQLLQKHYDGFLRKGKLKGRYDRLSQGSNAAPRTAIPESGEFKPNRLWPRAPAVAGKPWCLRPTGFRW